MREEESTWFSRWEEELPSPEELTPISQTLITPDLALAFDIQNPSLPIAEPPPPLPPLPQPPHSSEFDSGDLGAASGDEPARTLKRPRLVWTPQLHKRFVDAVAHLGIKNAVPKTIMQLMSVDGLTRENVASHLQKYRIYLKRMQGLAGGGVGNISSGDTVTDRLFSTSPDPHQFLHGNAGNGVGSEHYLPFVPGASLFHASQPQQMATASAIASVQSSQFHHRQIGQFEQGFYGRPQQVMHRMVGAATSIVPATSYVDDLDTRAGGGRKILTLFPTGDE